MPKFNAHEYLPVVGASMIFFICGFQFGTIGPALVKLESSGYYEIPPISFHVQSWMLSCCTLGIFPAAICASYLNDFFGRKYAIILSLMTELGVQVCAYFAMNEYMLYLGHLFRGAYAGFVFVLVPAYLSEVAPANVRGSTTALCILFVSISNRFVGGLAQSFLSIDTVALIGITLTVITFPVLCFLTESPYFYALKGRHIACGNALKKLRGTQNVEDELEEIKKATVEKLQTSRMSWIKLFTIPVNLKVLLICAGLQTVQELTGLLIMNGYAHKIIYDSGLDVSLRTISFILGTSNILANIFGIHAIEYWGRRPLFILVSGLACFGHCLTGLCLLLEDTVTKSAILGGLILVGIVFYELALGCGLLHLPNILSSELFPTQAKSKGCALLSMLSSIEGMIAAQLFELLFKINESIPFWGMSLVGFYGILHGIFFIPETKKKSLAKIQENLHFKVDDASKISVVRNKTRETKELIG